MQGTPTVNFGAMSLPIRRSRFSVYTVASHSASVLASPPRTRRLPTSRYAGRVYTPYLPRDSNFSAFYRVLRPTVPIVQVPPSTTALVVRLGRYLAGRPICAAYGAARRVRPEPRPSPLQGETCSCAWRRANRDADVRTPAPSICGHSEPRQGPCRADTPADRISRRGRRSALVTVV
jgi:DNA-binding transcriptional LysR family regulator